MGGRHRNGAGSHLVVRVLQLGSVAKLPEMVSVLEQSEQIEAAGDNDEATVDLAALASEADVEVAPEPMSMGHEEPDDGMHWYVVHTYSGYERKVKQSLEERIRTLELGDQVAELLIPTEDIVETISDEITKNGINEAVVSRMSNLHREYGYDDGIRVYAINMDSGMWSRTHLELRALLVRVRSRYLCRHMKWRRSSTGWRSLSRLRNQNFSSTKANQCASSTARSRTSKGRSKKSMRVAIR